MHKTVLAIDVGTSSLKAMEIDGRGRVLATAHFPFSGNPSTGAPFDAREWERALAQAIATIGSREPSAVVMSGHGPTLVPLGQDLEPLGPVLFWLDRKVVDVPGQSSFFLPKALWYRRTHPEDYQRVRYFLSCPEYLYLRLGADPFTVIPHEAYAPYYWQDDQFPAYGLDPSLFPSLVKTGDPVGRVGKEGEERFGLREGTPLIAGGADFLMSLVGSGTLRPGLVCDRAGSSEGVNACTGDRVEHPRLRTLPHVVPGLWNVGGIVPASGLLFEWFRSVTGQKHQDYRRMLTDITALDQDPTTPFFFLGPEGTARFGPGAFHGLDAHHSPAHLSRAVVESIGFAVAEAVESLGEAGIRPASLRMVGGQAKNPGWCEIKAQILGLPLEIPEIADAELLGNALVGLVSLGVYGDLEDAAEACVRMERVHEPRPERLRWFEDRRERWTELRETIYRN